MLGNLAGRLVSAFLSSRWLVIAASICILAWQRSLSKTDFQVLDPISSRGTKLAELVEVEVSRPVVVVAHIFHRDQVGFFSSALNRLPINSEVLITTPDEYIIRSLRKSLDKNRLRIEIRCCQNRGRNFGPLLVEFRHRLLEVEDFIHVHSKSSSHAHPRVQSAWKARLFGLFLDRKMISRVGQILDHNKNVGLVYPAVWDLFKGLSFRWALSSYPLKSILSRIVGAKTVDWHAQVNFPAGGMFWVRTNAIRPVLEHSWSYDDFPPESGQLGGTLQHGIEKLMGTVPNDLGFDHLVYRVSDDAFYII